MTGLVHCIYASTATVLFQEHTLPALLKKTRSANAAHGVTGMLLYIEGSFFQVLEGVPGIVGPLYEVICHDPRHTRVTQVIGEPIVRRAFADWTMGFANVSKGEVGELLGQNDFFATGTCLETLEPGRARKLLNAFQNGSWRTERTGTHRVHSRVS